MCMVCVAFQSSVYRLPTETHPGGFSPKLIPLVLEHFVFWGQEGQRFLHEISQRSRDEDGKANSIEFKTYWRCLFSMTLQRCNASVRGVPARVLAY